MEREVSYLPTNVLNGCTRKTMDRQTYNDPSLVHQATTQLPHINYGPLFHGQHLLQDHINFYFQFPFLFKMKNLHQKRKCSFSILNRRGSNWCSIFCSGQFFFSSFLFFCDPSYISGVHHFLVRFLHMWPFYTPTIEVVTFHLHGWCMLGVFLLPAFTCLGHERQDLLSLCNGMHVCTH